MATLADSSRGSMSKTGRQRTPGDVREGVRTGVLAALARDFELIGGRTARRLTAAGVLGVVGAVGATFLVSGHPFDHHPPWHVLVFSTIWAGLLIVSLSLILLQIRAPGVPIGRAAAVGVLGLGLAGICSVVCPDQHFLNWWTTTSPGARTMAFGGVAVSALCFGFVTSFIFGALAAFLVLQQRARGAWGTLLPATALFLLLEPGVALQSIGTSRGVLAAWTIGTAVGSYAGVAGGLALRVSATRWVFPDSWQ